MRRQQTSRKRFFVAVMIMAVASLFGTSVSASAADGRLRERLRERIQERGGERGGQQDRGGIRERLKERMQDRRGGNDSGEQMKIAGMDVAVWQPSGGGAAPLVVFSHGFHGNNTQSVFLMEALASAGFLVVAPNHKDAGRGANMRPEESFRNPENWSDKTYKDREQDIAKLLDALQKDAQWSGKIDWNRVGAAGHSLGGYTVLGVGGAWASWKRPEIKAVLALSPVCSPYVENGELGAMGVPVMYQSGTRDLGILPSIKRPGGAYDKTASPCYFVEFQGAGHFSWTNMKKEHHDLIAQYSVAFFQKFLNGQDSPQLETQAPGATLKSK